MLRNDQGRLVAQQIVPMEQAMSRLAKAVELVLNPQIANRKLLEELKALLMRSPGSLPIYLTLQEAPGASGAPVRLRLAEDFKIDPSVELLDDLTRLLGEEAVIVRRQPKSESVPVGRGRFAASRSARGSEEE